MRAAGDMGHIRAEEKAPQPLASVWPPLLPLWSTLMGTWGGMVTRALIGMVVEGAGWEEQRDIW